MNHLRHDELIILFFDHTAYHPRIDAEVWRTERDMEQRVNLLRQRIRCYSQALVSPILYRSHLFTPISHEAPSLLLDFIGLSADSSRTGYSHKRVHLTLYHLAFRYDVDSKWVQDLLSLLPQQESKNVAEPNHEASKPVDETPSMTRVSAIDGFFHVFVF
jgi:hypothetical protein